MIARLLLDLRPLLVNRTAASTQKCRAFAIVIVPLLMLELPARLVFCDVDLFSPFFMSIWLCLVVLRKPLFPNPPQPKPTYP